MKQSLKSEKTNKNHLEQNVMAKISAGEIKLKPKWFFILGSLLMVLGLIGASISAVFLINLSLFLFRQHGPMGEARLQEMISNFPWWIPLLAVGSLISAIFLLQKYDFSYKKNFSLIAVIFIVTIIVSAVIIDWSGINEPLFRQKRMHRLYQQNRLEI